MVALALDRVVVVVLLEQREEESVLPRKWRRIRTGAAHATYALERTVVRHPGKGEMPMPGNRRLLLAYVLVTALLALVVAAPTGAQEDPATKCVAAAVLKPGNEVRPADTTDPVESRAFGTAFVAIEGTRLSFAVAIVNPARETFVAGHIHAGAAGVNGGVVVGLFAGSANPFLFLQADRIEISEDVAKQICGDLAGHYVNYHTTQDPMGAVRGQLVGR
jgi:ABC-type amino acid transport substrate-binding protein